MNTVITGSAMSTSVGSDKHACFDAMCAGQSGLKPLQSFPADKFNAGHAYEIADRPHGRDRVLRASELLANAVAAAVKESGLSLSTTRCCVVVGTGLRELRSLELFWTEGQALSIDQLHFERALNHRLGTTLPVITISNACSASNFALAIAEDFLFDDSFDAVIVGGCDTITESMFGLLDRVNPLHADAVRPFDRDRRGVLMGDGAAAVVVESSAHAAAHQAQPLVGLRAVGTSCDANHETAPETGGIVRAVHDAYARGQISAPDVDFLMVHGTGTMLNDKTEALAMREAMGESANSVPISALKSMTGHTSGASGLVAVVASIDALNQGRLPPTVGLTNPMDEAVGMNIVVGEACALPQARLAQINAFGFGGVNAVVILEKNA